jgi:predicted ArsR family transcriptional regulator
MIDGRGKAMVKKGEETQAKVKKYVDSHPQALRQDICKALGISRLTLRKHLKALGLE